jgi:hypothetical protein
MTEPENSIEQFINGSIYLSEGRRKGASYRA